MSALLLAGLGGCGRSHEKAFVAEQRAAAAGYRLEHFAQERLLFVHRPNGDKDGIELATLRRVFLHRQDARDSTDNKTKYWLTFQGPDRSVFTPFFAVEPRTVVSMLEGELDGFDEAAALKMSAAFQEGRGRYCELWASAAYLQETRSRKADECKP